uniref:Uncharacterized protein n=1 Tax=Arundo donax TaxID=35708 RepID=A0A0A9BXF5_ARUDO
MKSYSRVRGAARLLKQRGTRVCRFLDILNPTTTLRCKLSAFIRYGL